MTDTPEKAEKLPRCQTPCGCPTGPIYGYVGEGKKRKWEHLAMWVHCERKPKEDA